MKFEEGLSTATKMYSNTLQEQAEDLTKKFAKITILSTNLLIRGRALQLLVQLLALTYQNPLQ